MIPICLSFFSDGKATIRKKLVHKGVEFINKKSPIYPYRPYAKELTIDLKDPTYKHGVLYTFKGGVIKNKDIRIQARSIQYFHRKENGIWVHRIEAEGDLMVQYKGRVYVGSELTFDFNTKTGVVYDGRTFIPPFYIGGDRILLEKEGAYKVENAYLTACENKKSSWEIRAKKVKVVRKEMLKAKQVRFRLFKFPTFWLPSFKLNLKKFPKPIVRYNLTWDKGAGPRFAMRYQVYSWKDFAFFLRGEYRLRKGFGGALETEYLPEHGRTKFITKNYLASDVLPTDPIKRRRYRVQGELRSRSKSSNSSIDLTWDKYSDVLMPGDFKSTDFEINTAKKTQLYAYHKQDDFIAYLRARPKVNSFNSVKQELPVIFGHMKPILLSKTNFLTDNWTKAGFLKQDFSDDLSIHLAGFQAVRLQSDHNLYYALHKGPFSFTPNVGVVAIYYSDSPDEQGIAFGMIRYGGLASFEMFRKFSRHKHIIRPYFNFYGLSKPTTNVDDHFIFSIQDGYNRLNQLTVGIKNLLYSFVRKKGIPTVGIDLYAHAFLGPTTFSYLIPKLYLDFEWNLPSLSIYSYSAWNLQHNRLDYSNLRFKWTISEDAALSTEVRYRSKFDWRKADHTNFILDVTRSQSELLSSPISDRRLTLLTRAFFRLTPFWTLHLQSHHGWSRIDEGPYNEWKIDLFRLLSAFWKARITYQHTQRDDRVTFGFELLKK